MKEALIELIKKSGLRDSEFADKCGFTRSQVSDWVNGHKKIQYKSLSKAAAILGYRVKISVIKEKPHD